MAYLLEDSLSTTMAKKTSRKDTLLKRKNYPIYSGVIKYFPLALKEISAVSKAGNDQHNPDKDLFWDRTKSTDELDALMRHLIDHARGEIYDIDDQRHLAKVAWRALAMLQKELE